MNFKTIKDKITKKLNKQSIKVFFQKQGLYVLIFLCVAAAGITAIVAWPRDNTEQISDSGTDVSVNEGTTLEEELAANATSSPKPSVSVSPTPSPSAQSTEETAQAVVNNGSGSITLKKPVSGKVINAFSGEALIYFASLNVWQTHNGIDIEAAKAAPVTAAISGTVSDANVNEADGGIVIIASDKTQTVYAGLDNIRVKQGDKVSVGDQLGEIGEMPRELDLGYHLHFEYIVDNVYKDPAKFMEK